MPLQAGTTLGPYTVTAQIGAGGMGEVYRARDTKLDRDVALKVLPEAFTADPDRLARFEREAKVLASLNHPNIGSIYGLEEAEGTKALVLELVEGPTLADRIKQGPIPLDEALPIAKQIAEALEAAHEQGIIHRDLKPANVKVKADGTVKVLDFGLAKAVTGDLPAADFSQTATVTADGTRAGVILGTAAYMSPEQAAGRSIGHRTDVWAFGCVLYEMLTGRRAFESGDLSEVLAGVIKSEPNWDALPKLSPVLGSFLKRCVHKDPKQRVQAIGDLRLALEGAFEAPAAGAPGLTAAASSPRPPWRRAVPLIASVLVVGIGALFAGRMSVPEAPRQVIRSSHLLPEGTFFRNAAWNPIDISSDGERFVYSGLDGLVVRELDSLQERVIPNTASAAIGALFLSPDGQSVGFFDFVDGQLMRIAVNGGAPLTLTSLNIDVPPGAVWDERGTILYGLRDGIWEVADSGGEPRQVIAIEPGEQADSPQRLPDGDRVLFALARTTGPNRWHEADIVVESLESGERRTIWSGGSSARYVPTGHLVFSQDDVLYAMPFDAEQLEVSGVPTPVVEGVRRAVGPEYGNGAAFYAFSQQGTLIYVPSTGESTGLTTLGVADRNGQTEPLAMAAGTYDYPRASPDGRRVAFTTVYGDGTDISVYGIGSGTAPRRLTFGGGSRYPVWSSDGERVAFQNVEGEGASIFWQAADGSGLEERLTTAEDGSIHVPDSFSSDGAWLSFTVSSGNESAVWLLSVATGDAELLIAEPGARVSQSVLSPDDRWIAYQSTETGQDEIFVQPFPPTGAKHQLPGTLDNHHPFWAPDGRALFYVPGPGLFAVVNIATDGGFEFGNPVRFDLNGPLRMAPPQTIRRVDVLPDGRFVGVLGELNPVTGEPVDPAFQIHIVQHWFEELKRLVPTN